MKEFTNQLPEISLSGISTPMDRADRPTPARWATSAGEFRALERLLTSLDPMRRWGGLTRTTTPEGLSIFVCGDHLAEYHYPAARRSGA